MKGLEFRYFLWFSIKTEWIEAVLRAVSSKVVRAQSFAEGLFGYRLVRRVGPEHQDQERHEIENLSARYAHMGGGF